MTTHQDIGCGASGADDPSVAIADRLKRFATEFDARLAEYLGAFRDIPSELQEAMRYSALAPGKRVRPYLVVRCCELVGGRRADAWAPAAAVECVHAFSLIHDDLPAMDDDDLRRGRPTCHKQFGEALAILAGDALVVFAFELLATRMADPALAAAMVAELAGSAGGAGMIGGQAADILGESRPPEATLAAYIHDRKTASLFAAACRMGARAGRASPELIALLGGYGADLGRAFQIADDLLDLTATAQTLGKDCGKDERRGKQTFPRCVGREASRQAAQEAVQRAVSGLLRFGAAAYDLRELAAYVVHRNY
ncbi:MAG: polyprenyl synthetase family protein [Planctomycetes bacterium]|nr:polyprenyl synthetase family protein [Planctomycetota bacterium]